jgi:hypothetical protein
VIILELTCEQVIAHARHEAEEQGRKFDPKAINKGVRIDTAGRGCRDPRLIFWSIRP